MQPNLYSQILREEGLEEGEEISLNHDEETVVEEKIKPEVKKCK